VATALTPGISTTSGEVPPASGPTSPTQGPGSMSGTGLPAALENASGQTAARGAKTGSQSPASATTSAAGAKTAARRSAAEETAAGDAKTSYPGRAGARIPVAAARTEPLGSVEAAAVAALTDAPARTALNNDRQFLASPQRRRSER
jgi:hypothetical protein